MLSVLKRLVVGTPLEGPARHLLALRSPVLRKNRRDDEALRALISSLPDDADCVDVGANVGHILDAMVHGCPQGRHIAFEPVPRLADDLRRRFPRVDVRNQAVADVPGRTAFTIVLKKPTRSGISATLDLTVDGAVEEIDAEVTTLDEALPADFRPALVKIDVEGGELEVLLGARRSLSEKRPVVAFEHQYGRRSDTARTLRIHDLLTEVGYEVRTISGTPLDRQRFADAVATRAEWNFLAYPDRAR
jgi:FkbM family methyltransferase